MKRILTLLIVLVTVFSMTSCIDRSYSVKEGNDAVSAAQQIVDRTVESGCSAEKYTMDITLDTEKNTLSGKETVMIVNNSGGELDEICFRYFAPAFTKESQISRISNKETDEEYSFTKEVDDTFYRVTLPGAMDMGEKITLDVEFTSYISQISDRFGIVSLGENEKLYNLTFCFPQVAFLDNGVWFDSKYFENGEALYNEMSDYYVTLNAPEEYLILSSGRSVTEGTITTITAENIREMAISACNCGEIYTKESDGVTYNVLKLDLDYDNKELLSDMYELIMKTAVESVEIFSRDVGDYVYDEIDIIPVVYEVGYLGGMEYPGLVQVAVPMNDRLGDDPEIYMDELFVQLNSLVEIVCHEVGHEWFYCAVGNDELNEPWIDESFTSYLDVYFRIECQRTLEFYQNMLRDYFDEISEEYVSNYSFYEDELEDNKYYINFPADEYKKDDYGYVYSYGENFLQNLERAMGKDKFFEMLSIWYSENLNGIVEGYAFINHVMEYDSSDEVKKVINDYISDEHLK